MTKRKIKPAVPAKKTDPYMGKRPLSMEGDAALSPSSPAPEDAPAGAPIPPQTDHPIEPVLTAEQQAEIDQLAGRISETEIDPTLDPQDHADLDVPPATFLDDASLCVDMFVMFAVEHTPAVEPLWPEPKKRTVSKALAKVFEKYNFSFARFGPEIALVVAAGPVLYQTSKVIALHMQQAPVPQARAHEAEKVVSPT